MKGNLYGSVLGTFSHQRISVVKRQYERCLAFALWASFTIALLSWSVPVAAQSKGATEEIETQIRKLEVEQVDYLMSGNVAGMKKNWAPNFTVNNPFNVVQDASTGPIQTGNLTYQKFERNIEKILIHDSTIIVMGNELVIPKTAPKGSSHDTNKPIKRRFTNVWMVKDGTWLMIARHANQICSN